MGLDWIRRKKRKKRGREVRKERISRKELD